MQMQLDDSALLLARSHYHTLGSPRGFQMHPNGTILYFTRSDGPTATVQALWQYNSATATETVLFDPLQHGYNCELSDAERAQREVLRETSHGITSYTISKDGSYICFTSGSTCWLLKTADNSLRELTNAGQIFDPRFSPDGTRLGYTNVEGVWSITLHEESAQPQLIIANQSDDVYYGRAEFIAAEEIGRYRGFWWAADSRRMVIARVDESAVTKAYRHEVDPFTEPTMLRYPAAGTANAVVTLSIYKADDTQESPVAVSWDADTYPYVTNVQWHEAGLYISVQSRDQKTLLLYRVSDNGETDEIHRETSQTWVDVIQPLPVVTDSGVVVSLSGTNKRRIAYNGAAFTDPEHHVDDYIGIAGDWIIYTASPDPKERVVYAAHITSGQTEQLSPSGGLFSGLVTGNAVFVAGSVMGGEKLRFVITDIDSHISSKVGQQLLITSHASTPEELPEPIFFTVGDDKLQASLLLPADIPTGTTVPVILQVYGGPHHQEVLYSRSSYLEQLWWTKQGYAVLTADGPGSPGKDLAWEHMIAGDLIGPAAAAHMTVLQETLRRYPQLDPKRVASRGWSFGGYLSAFLSIRYPEHIQACISGAPVTDWALYDTHYTERYIGDPTAQADAYAASSLVKAAQLASRPILLIHGLSDDNVLIANSLKLIEALSAANCPYQFLPLNSFSHFPKEAEQSAWLLQMQCDFLDKNLTSHMEYPSA